MSRIFFARRSGKRLSPFWREALGLAAACLACAAALILLEAEPATPSDGAPLSPWRQGAQQLLSLAWEEQGKRRTVTAALSGGYILEEDRSVVLDTEKTEALLSACMSMRLTPVAVQSDAAGLRSDTLEMRGSRETVKLRLGDAAPGGGRYALWEDRMYLTNAFPDGPLQLSALRAVPALYADGTFPDTLTIARGDDVIRAGVYNGRSLGVSTLYLLEPFVWEMDIEKAAQLLEKLNALKLQAWAGSRGDRTDAAWGLEQGTVITAAYAAQGQDSPVTWTLTLGAKAEDGMRYAAVSGLTDVFLVAAEEADWFEQLSPLSLINRFAGLVSIDAMSAVTAEYAGKRMTLEKGGDSRPWLINGKLTDEQTFKALYQELLAPRVDGQADAAMRAAAGETLLKLTYSILDGNPEVIAYRGVSQEYDLVERNGESLFYIQHAKVQKLLETLEKAEE